MIYTFDDQFTSDPVWKTGNSALFQSVIDLFNDIYPIEAPAKDRKLHILRSIDVPRCDHSQSISYYNIYLCSPDGQYNRLAYQLSHELCHIYCDPRRSNRLVECICEMMSIYTLNYLSKQWITNPPVTGWNNYAVEFNNMVTYQNSLTRRRLGLQESDTEETIKTWIKNNKDFFKINRTDGIGRDENRLIAELLLPIFESNNQLFQVLPFLGKSTTHTVTDATSAFDFINDDQIEFDTLKKIAPQVHTKKITDIESIYLLSI